jgi:hypothetical protein
MGDERTKFIILCAARAGSTMLRHLRNSHPDVCCYGEIMADQVTPDRWNSEAEPVDRAADRSGPRSGEGGSS